jgi:hypothetical protein
MGNELAKMIDSIDENQLIVYVKEELERREHIRKSANTLGHYFQKYIIIFILNPLVK